MKSPTVNVASAEEFLSQHRIAVVGASDDPKNFGRTVLRELRQRGYDAVAVHPSATTVDGQPCFASLSDVPGVVDGVIVMVPADRAVTVIRDCAGLGIRHVWLFRGVGGSGADSEEARALCAAFGITVVAGACPLMFLQPVGWVHRLHRGAKRLRGSLAS
jgi:predicted CoA-binding protein